MIPTRSDALLPRMLWLTFMPWGGQSKTASSIVGFPALGVDFSVFPQVMNGGISMLNEAGLRFSDANPFATMKSNLVTL
jgi:hypothetical protein